MVNQVSCHKSFSHFYILSARTSRRLAGVKKYVTESFGKVVKGICHVSCVVVSVISKTSLGEEIFRDVKVFQHSFKQAKNFEVRIFGQSKIYISYLKIYF